MLSWRSEFDTERILLLLLGIWGAQAGKKVPSIFFFLAFAKMEENFASIII